MRGGWVAFSLLVAACAGAAARPIVFPGAQAEGPADGPKVFRECVAARTWGYSGNHVNDGDPFDKTLKVPAGWTPIGGGGIGTGSEGVAILCR